MRRNSLYILIFVVGVDMYTMEEQEYISTEPTSTENFRRNPFGDLDPFSFDDFRRGVPPFDDPKICHIPNFKCLSQVVNSPICGVVKHEGLVNFINVCEIHIHNCIVQPVGSKHVYGVPSTYDVIYYNGKKHDCSYYIKEEQNHGDAIRLYYKAGYENDLDNNIEDIDI